MKLPKPSLIQAIKDTYGTLFRVPKVKPTVDVKGKRFEGSAHVDVWWDRESKDKRDETLLIRQENEDKRADVVALSQGQVYGLIEALNRAIESR